MKKVMLIFLLFFNICNISAYENNYFFIDIPDEYKLVINENNIYKWKKDNKYISITISDNVNGYHVKNYTDNDIKNQKIYIEDKINSSLSEYDTNVSVSEINKSKINDFDTLSYTIYWPTKEQTGNDIYQFGNVISTDNYIYTIVYNSNNNVKDDEFNSILNSFIPNDKININNNYDFLKFIIVFVAFLFAIVNVIKRYKKKN